MRWILFYSSYEDEESREVRTKIEHIYATNLWYTSYERSLNWRFAAHSNGEPVIVPVVNMGSGNRRKIYYGKRWRRKVIKVGYASQ